MEQDEYEDIISHLAAAVVQQGTLNENLLAMLANHQALFHQQGEINTHIVTTLTRLEMLLARLIAQGETSQEA